MKKISLFVSILIMTVLSLSAQTDGDAYVLSQTQYQGTARFMGAGGAFSSVGGEFSALNINPAAIGIYKRSEVTFTPMVISIFKNNTSYNGGKGNSMGTKYTLSNAGMVFKMNLKNESWKAMQIGFGYNRINDFNNVIRVEGLSNNTSIMNNIVDRANANYLDIDENLALATGLLKLDTCGNYSSPFQNKSLNQKMVMTTKGGVDEMSFTIGANYQDKLFIGATVGFPFLDYKRKINYGESYPDGSIDTIQSFETKDNLSISSTGVNLKLGIIYQPVNFFRFGLAFHTPTFYENVKDLYSKEMTTYYDDGYVFDETKDPYYINYMLITPLKAVGSVAFLIKQRAFISAEYEFTSYAMSQLISNTESFQDVNDEIQAKYHPCHKVRIGAELNVTPHFLLRAGYNFKSSGYSKNVDNKDFAHAVSVGFGFRAKYFFFDMAYIYNVYNESMYLYDMAYVSKSNLNYNTHRIVATFGCKF